MNRVKDNLYESCSSHKHFLRFLLSEKLSEYFTPNIESEFWKCPIFVGSVENFGNSLEKK